jgi:hypothetical protein
MPEVHALITGPIQGRIPDGDGGFLDVTPDVLLLDSPEAVQAAAEAIEVEHAVRGTHPVQQECAVLGPVNAALQESDEAGRSEAIRLGVHDHKNIISAHQKAHKALNKKAGL